MRGTTRRQVHSTYMHLLERALYFLCDPNNTLLSNRRRCHLRSNRRLLRISRRRAREKKGCVKC